MNPTPPHDLSSLTMIEVFRLEVDSQTALLTTGLLDLERRQLPGSFDALMRAAHSLKGAARIVNLQAAVNVAHAMEDCFVAARQDKIRLRRPEIDLLLRGVDLLADLGKRTEADVGRWETDRASDIGGFLSAVAAFVSACGLERQSPAATGSGLVSFDAPPEAADWSPGETPGHLDVLSHATAIRRPEPAERYLRLTAESLNRLLALAGESLVESRWLRPFADSLQRLKRHHMDLAEALDQLRQSFGQSLLPERAAGCLNDLSRQLAQTQHFLAERLQELDMFDRRSAHLSQHLYLEVLRTRMRPFSDGARRFPRMVRDLARPLGKEVRLEVFGENTQVDRDILERLETPLAHLLRNAVDHGCETPEDRVRAGKPPECTIRLEARHSAGALVVTVADDGAGVDLERVRAAIVSRGLTTQAVAAKLLETELLDFLFLPGFTLKETVTEISGRGFGLDIVQNMVRSVRGAIRLGNQSGSGLRIQLQLPLTLSVLRALLVQVGSEPYAIPLNQIARTLALPRASIQSLEGWHHFQFGDQQIGLLTAHEILDCPSQKPTGNDLPVVVLGDRNARYGLVVDRFLGQRELVVQPLDPRLGKIRDIGAAALMEDGVPVLILDVEDMIRSIDNMVAGGRLPSSQHQSLNLAAHKPKRILAVDDSLTVRELERKLLTSRGYMADIAVDGMDAWNAVRSGDYDLVITDIDMPRMDGIELTTLIKTDPRLKSLSVLIVSYKDQEEDRMRGLEAGADYYLTKGSFHDETLLQAVTDLIGEADT